MDKRLTEDVMNTVFYERERQEGQRQPEFDGTGGAGDAYRAERAALTLGRSTDPSWRDELHAALFAALAEADETALRHALIRSAAVTVRWIEELDRRWLEKQRQG